MEFLLLFLCFIMMGCCSSSLIKYVSNLIASSSLIEYVSNLMASSSSSSSHDPAQMKYEVFISFRGSDVRRGFLSHLTKALRQKQIDVYEDERLERGDEISSALVKAIEASEISLIIFSKDYATSKWCLEELVKIMECKELNKQTVIPVFYNIDPTDVRHQKGTYKDAFAQHERKFKDNKEKVQNWRSALNKAANLSGCHYLSNSEKDESEFIDEIVKDVLKKNGVIYPYKSKGLVGIEENFAHIESLLEIESKEVRIIGIWGMGGVGKTTLAHAVCDKFCSQFERSCFLENVRESKKSNGLNYLLEKLFSVLLEEENLRMNDVEKVRSYWGRLSRRKVFIVLDDVDTSQQIKDLVGEPDSLGQGSKVIVTSRDKHVLISGEVHKIHEIKGLNCEKSLELFSLNAFKQSHPHMGYEEVSKMVVTYAQGVPLALKVLGLHFKSRNMEMWPSELKQLKMSPPNMEIQNVLRVSYDGLNYVLKDIFLDIAFFFKGESKDDIIRVLDARGFQATIGIGHLVEKALITISRHNTIEMHDLIQEMGEQIVCEECVKDPGRRSRLKNTKEIYDVLKNNTGTEVVEGIILDMSQIRYVELRSNTFKKMPNLKFLKFYNGHQSYIKLPSTLKSFSDKLRYFHWDGYPLKSLPSNFCAEQLVELNMEKSKAIKLWDGVQDLVNLKIINLSGSSCLLELPDFSTAQRLEKMYLSKCESLCNIHPSILTLHSLVSLSLDSCTELKSLESEVHLKSLQNLYVSSCPSLKKFSLSSEKLSALLLENPSMELVSSLWCLSNLRCLILRGSGLWIHSVKDLGRLTYLEWLHFSDCGQLIDKGKLRILFDSLHSLKRLDLIGYSDVYGLPDNISGLSSLQTLFLRESSIESLPASIKHLSNLKTMKLNNCRMLRFVPELPPFITDLYANNCSSLKTVLTSTTFALQQHRVLLYYISSFQNCKTLDGPSLIKFVQYWVKRAVYNNSGLYICYPRNRVPEWFGYQQIGTTITIEFASLLDDLKGFILCFVAFFSMTAIGNYKLHCRWYFGDEEVEYLKVGTDRLIDFGLKSDHVFLMYEPFEYKYLVQEVEIRRGNGEGITYNPKLSFKFSLVSHAGFPVSDECLIEACGVSPIYASENHIFLQQMGLKMKTKRRRDIDEQQQLPPAKRFLHRTKEKRSTGKRRRDIHFL